MRLSRRCGLLAVLVGALLLPLTTRAHADGDAGAPCTADELDKSLADIAHARAGVTTLSGPFTQERTIGLLAAKVRSTGTLTLVRPDKMRWELAAPDGVVYWVTPDGLAYKSASGSGKAPAASQKIAGALSDLRVLLGGDLGSLRGRYDLTGTCEGGRTHFRAVPKAGSAVTFQEMRFTLAPDLVSPESVTIVEGARDRTEIRFGTMQKNVTVAPGLMGPS